MFDIRIHQTALAKGIPLPARSHQSDVGFDLRTAIDFDVLPGDSIKVPTGLIFDMPCEEFRIGDIPVRLCLIIEQRTGNGGKGLYPAATIVDAGYRPERDDEKGLTLWLRNVGNDKLSFKRGDAVMQGIFQLIVTPQLVPVSADEITWDTDRGSKRFGATGS